MKTKTLREHLLDRDAAVTARLDALRRDVLAAELGGGGAAHRSPTALAVLRTLWRELVQPCGGTWATLAAAWVAVLAFTVLGRVDAPTSPRLNADDAVALHALWREQRQLLLTLESGRPAVGATPPQSERPAPPARDAGRTLKPFGYYAPATAPTDGAAWV
jgi:HAMP domain-containing protein